MQNDPADFYPYQRHQSPDEGFNTIMHIIMAIGMMSFVITSQIWNSGWFVSTGYKNEKKNLIGNYLYRAEDLLKEVHLAEAYILVKLAEEELKQLESAFDSTFTQSSSSRIKKINSGINELIDAQFIDSQQSIISLQTNDQEIVRSYLTEEKTRIKRYTEFVIDPKAERQEDKNTIKLFVLILYFVTIICVFMYWYLMRKHLEKLKSINEKLESSIIEKDKLYEKLQVKNSENEELNGQLRSLMQEQNHRIKNDMMSLHCAIEEKAENTNDSKVRKALEAVSLQVETILMVYKQLFDKKQYHNLSLYDYLSALLQKIQTSKLYPVAQFSYNVELSITDIAFECVRDIGIIIIEVLQNAFKYAPNTAISVNIENNKDDLMIEIQDSGNGLLENHKDGFGIEFVKGTVEKMNGEITFLNNQTGLNIDIKIPLLNLKKQT